MDVSDINEVIKLLQQSIRYDDWDLVEEAIDYLKDFADETTDEEE